jgi:ADP-dependent NAD(P)H-hydrate dehydratase
VSSAKSIDPDLLKNWPLPDPGASKDDRGSALIIGGGRRSPGAVILSAEAALRSGCGRVTLATGPSSTVAVPTAVPESGVSLLEEDKNGHIRGSSIVAAEAEINAASAILVGPGLDDIDETVALLDALLRFSTNSVPMVWDAFTIGALASFPELGERADQRLILTPNKAELALLIGRDTSDLERDVQEAAEQHRAVVSC